MGIEGKKLARIYYPPTTWELPFNYRLTARYQMVTVVELSLFNLLISNNLRSIGWFLHVSSGTEVFNHRLTPINTDSVEANKTNLR